MPYFSNAVWVTARISVTWDVPGRVQNRSHSGWEDAAEEAASGQTSQAASSCSCSSAVLCLTQGSSGGSFLMYLEGDQDLFTAQTCNNFLQHIVVSHLCNRRESGVSLTSSVHSMTVLSLWLQLFPISSSVFADHHPWPQDFLPCLYFPPEWEFF